MNQSDRDTIVAIATAPGEGGIGIVRMSGPRAVEIASPFFKANTRLEEAESHKLNFGRFAVGSRDLDQVLASVMKAPDSYTGQDTVEFNCHGGPFLLRKVVEALVANGARVAERGEFTKRAFLNGKLDLSQAEAVADLISCRSDLGLDSAYFQLRGALRDAFNRIADDLREALVFLEGSLDFGDEIQIDFGSIQKPVARAQQTVTDLLASYQTGKLIREGALVLLTGRPNVGKSSLLNFLLNQERAIVSAIPGTTRDTIEEYITLEGLPIKLVDTAGLRHQTADIIEREGSRRAREFMDQADVVLFLCDGAQIPTPEDKVLADLVPADRSVVVFNKADIRFETAWQSFISLSPQVNISAKTGKGVDELKSVLVDRLQARSLVPSETITHERHFLGLRQSLECLERFQEGVESGLPGELVSLDLNLALQAISAIIGETTPDDVLEAIFKTFCIGK
ncbi:MAG: tRNA uridine-5-carboxymethylaminomethyl(34) synthesis GTPase MnmE [bacterium]|nr:tRNA uridine-5-carboxymethylaminomethyl(34) synthesis GTPase MnmE [bacterium]